MCASVLILSTDVILLLSIGCHNDSLCTGIFRKCKQLPSTFEIEANNLYKKYRPIEIDESIPIEKRIKAMVEWMAISNNILKGFHFDPQEIDDVAKTYGNALRERSLELFTKMRDMEVPILVFSAGLGDVVEAILRHHDVFFSNVNIVSNFLKFNGKQLDGFKGDHEPIHVFNKNEHAVEHKYFQILQGRANVILMGDLTGDSNMANDVKDIETILKIGFLYDNVSLSFTFVI